MPRTTFSIVIIPEFDGTYSAHVTDYRCTPSRSLKSMCFKTARAARAEAKQIVTRWRYATDSINQAAGKA
jgi:hypothetical protein